MNIKGAIFDLDGVLLDSMVIWDTLGETYLISQGIKPLENVRETLRPMSLIQAAQYFRDEYEMIESVQVIIDGINRLVEHFYIDLVEMKPGVIAFLDKLKENHVKMCITTASDRFMVEAALKRNAIEQYFDKIFTCTEVGQGKDKPDIYLCALEFLGIKKRDVFVFEDALYAIKTAKKADFQVIAVYDSTAQDQETEIKKLADAYIMTFLDIEIKDACIQIISE